MVMCYALQKQQTRDHAIDGTCRHRTMLKMQVRNLSKYTYLCTGRIHQSTQQDALQTFLILYT